MMDRELTAAWIARQLGTPTRHTAQSVADMLARCSAGPVTLVTSDGRSYLVTRHDGTFTVTATGAYARVIAQRLDAQHDAAQRAYY